MRYYSTSIDHFKHSISTAPLMVSALSRLTPQLSPWLATNKGKPNKIYVRWITQRGALDASYLRDISVDRYPSDGTTTVSELKALALKKINAKNSSDLDGRPEGIHLELFWSHCYLSDTSENTWTVADVAPEGISHQDPINIFVAIIRKTDNPAKHQDNWAFECTDRSAATFMTSLEVMIHEINKSRVKLDCFLEVVWAVTHFPPTLLSFKQVFENVLPSAGNLKVSEGRALSILADSFREVARRTVPPWICKSTNTLLESSRQIFGWLHTLSIQAALAEGALTLVYSTELQDITGRGINEQIAGLYKHKENVDIKNVDGDTKKRTQVSLMSLSHVSPQVFECLILSKPSK